MFCGALNWVVWHLSKKVFVLDFFFVLFFVVVVVFFFLFSFLVCLFGPSGSDIITINLVPITPSPFMRSCIRHAHGWPVRWLLNNFFFGRASKWLSAWFQCNYCFHQKLWAVQKRKHQCQGCKRNHIHTSIGSLCSRLHTSTLTTTLCTPTYHTTSTH